MRFLLPMALAMTLMTGPAEAQGFGAGSRRQSQIPPHLTTIRLVRRPIMGVHIYFFTQDLTVKQTRKLWPKETMLHSNRSNPATHSKMPIHEPA
jgi:hypothetical protein